MKYVYPFLGDLAEDEEALVSETVEKLTAGRFTSSDESLRVIHRLYEVIEGLRQHNAELEELLKGVYQSEWRARD